jgi:hypothetical protein
MYHKWLAHEVFRRPERGMCAGACGLTIFMNKTLAADDEFAESSKFAIPFSIFPVAGLA